MKYFAVLDTALHQLNQRFDAQTSALNTYLSMENMFLQGVINPDVVKLYPELDAHSLSLQLPMFKSQFLYSNVDEGRQRFQEFSPEVRCLFNQVEQLLRLLLIIPASSCSAERSFSALRRLKTWLRNTMSQQRLNSIAVCHVHQDLLDKLDLQKLATEFAGRSDIRRRIFGSFT